MTVLLAVLLVLLLAVGGLLIVVALRSRTHTRIVGLAPDDDALSADAWPVEVTETGAVPYRRGATSTAALLGRRR